MLIAEPKLVVVESPYAGEIGRNVAYARSALKDCLARGEHPIASHLLYTQPGVLDDGLPDERKRGIEAGFAWWERADMIVFYLDHGVSPGMIDAMLRASAMGKMVDFRKITEPSKPETPPAFENNPQTPQSEASPPEEP